ncbi:MAG: FkbM family methyltransferase [Wenzhouxiangella sp.]
MRHRLAAIARRILGEYRFHDLQFRLGRLPRNAWYDRLSALIIKAQVPRDGVCVDVGAFRGEITTQFLEAAPDGTVLAIEPLPDQAAALRQRFPQNRVKILELALSDRAGRSDFNQVLTNPAYSGLRRRRYDRSDERDCSIQVETARLDELLAEHIVDRLDLIKIDVEGGEYGVLLGGLESLRRYRPLVLFEHGRGASDCYDVGPEQVWQLLDADCNMAIFRLPDWLRSRPAMTRAAFVDNFHSGPDYFFVAAPKENGSNPAAGQTA